MTPGRAARWTLLFTLALAACRPVGAPRTPGPAAAGETLPPADEVRGLWVVRTTLGDPDAIREMVRRADEAGFNTLLVQVRGRGDAYYRSDLLPLAPAVAERPGFDPLALVIDEAHRRGIEVHAWVNTYIVAGLGDLPEDPRHVVRAHPEWLAVPRDLARELRAVDPRDPAYVQRLLAWAREHRDRVEGLYLSPARPEVKERIYRVWMELARGYELDGIHFDYVRYPGPDFDYSPYAVDRFRRWVSRRLSPARRAELERASGGDPLAWPDALPGPWDEFRREQVSELVERVSYGVKADRPDLLVSAAVFADPVDAVRYRYQDWPSWVAEGLLDVVAPMAYTPDDERFRSLVADAVERAGPRRVWAGIGAYQTTPQGTLDKIDIARRQGAHGVLLFSYDWAVSEGGPIGDEPFLLGVGRRAFGGRR
ncbi:MAG: hypothetical protein D6701_03320 [Gemmatimonadetes bacterium]|nr:MAG: hypothetical protein D6701_03320 [Gemmatimonadota bacterium]